jgi:hypothetical protein
MTRIQESVFGALDDRDSELLTELVGVECEFELVSPDSYGEGSALWAAEWEMVTDGSLRNSGAEFITPPVSVARAKDMLDVMYRAKDEFAFEANVRTSMHVHVNVRYLTHDELRGVVATYCVLEPALFAICGEVREENIYCVPFYRSNHPLYTLVKVLNRKQVWKHIHKYSALNLGSIGKYGTIEFRHAPMWESAELAKAWVSLVAGVVRVGMTMSPEGVRDRVFEHGAGHLVDEVMAYAPEFSARLTGDYQDWLYEYNIIHSLALLVSLNREITPKTWKFDNMSPTARVTGAQVSYEYHEDVLFSERDDNDDNEDEDENYRDEYSDDYLDYEPAPEEALNVEANPPPTPGYRLTLDDMARGWTTLASRFSQPPTVAESEEEAARMRRLMDIVMGRTRVQESVINTISGES